MTFQDYLNSEFDEGKIDFSIRVYGIKGDEPEFYIHPTGKDGKTLDFWVTGNSLEPIAKDGKPITAPAEPSINWIDPMIEKPPMQRFVSGQGWVPSAKPYVLAVDVKGRMSVGYASEHSGERYGYRWTFAKPIGEPIRWMRLPDPPSAALEGE